MNLWDMLMVNDGAAAKARLHCWVDDHFDDASWSEVVRDAEEMTRGLRRAGVTPGTSVAAILTNNPCVVRGILGVWLAGGVIASLPVPARGMDMDEYVQQLLIIQEQLEPALCLVEQRMCDALPEDVRTKLRIHAWEGFAETGRSEFAPPEEDEVAFVQYSSGSTTVPKGCMLTPRAIVAQLELIFEMLDGRPGTDVTCAWLPLSHDMGMFGCLLTPWAWGGHLYLSTPERFMFSPKTWFGDLSEFGGHITAGTNTALYLAARSSRSIELPRELCVKSCIIGAERTEWDTLRLAVDVFGRAGFREEALMPAYGLAEATLAVTATPLEEKPRHVVIDAIALADGELREVSPDDESATRIVAAGVPRIGVELPGTDNGRLTEIQVRSQSLAVGYLGNEQRTRERFVDGVVLTDDLGFVRDGYLYPVGRVDDVISIGGRKVYAREIENAVDALSSVRRGCSTLIERRGSAGTALTLLVELRKTEDPNYRGLADEAASLAMAKAAVPLDECVFLERDSLPKTPSGKIQRHRCRQMLSDGRLQPLATVDLVATV
jgi:fatty-acyl-CoA synthase